MQRKHLSKGELGSLNIKLLVGMANEAHVLAKPQDIITSLSQIGGINGETIEKTWQFCMFVPEGPKDRDLDPDLKLVWLISTKARAHATSQLSKCLLSKSD